MAIPAFFVMSDKKILFQKLVLYGDNLVIFPGHK